MEWDDVVASIIFIMLSIALWAAGGLWWVIIVLAGIALWANSS